MVTEIKATNHVPIMARIRFIIAHGLAMDREPASLPDDKSNDSLLKIRTLDSLDDMGLGRDLRST